jgi:hypothetical protein
MGKKKKLKVPPINKGIYASAKEEGYEPSSESQYPVFAFYNSRNIEKSKIEGKSALIDILCRLSKLTWAQIRTESRRALGYEKISLKQIDKMIPENITPPINKDDKLMVFRFGPKKDKQYRMTGYQTSKTNRL